MFLYSSQQHCCFLYYRHSYRSFLSNAISLFCYYNYKISFSSPKQYYDNYFIFFSYSSIFYSKSNFYIANLCVNLLIYSCLTIMLSSLHLFSFSFSVLVLLISQKVYSLLLPKFLHLFYLLLNFSLMVFISLLFIFIFTTLISFFILYTALYLHPPIRLSLFHLRLFQYLKQILPQLNQQILIHLLIIP